MASVFRFLDGRSIEEVGQILSQFVTDDANLILKDVACNLTRENNSKAARDELVNGSTKPPQMVLLEEKTKYKSQQGRGANALPGAAHD